MALVTLAPIRGKLKNGVLASGFIPVSGDLSAGADTTIFTPVNPENYVAIMHLTYTKTLTAHTLSFKSGATNLLTLDMPANSGITHALGSGVYFMTEKGQPLVLNSSIALPSILLYVAEVATIEV